MSALVTGSGLKTRIERRVLMASDTFILRLTPIEMTAQEVEEAAAGLGVLRFGEEVAGAGDDESLDFLAVALQRLRHGDGLLNRHILVLVAMDQHHGRIDLRHAEDRRTPRQPLGTAQV